MSCTAGRVDLSAATRRRLWAESGGFCANPSDASWLFVDGSDADFGELAHIVAASPGGPRDSAEAYLSLPDRALPDNVVLLCANCHTVVDKDPAYFPVETLRAWKADHLERLVTAFGIARFDDRTTARAHVDPLLNKNRVVHQLYAPTAEDPYSPNADMWQRQVLSVVVPVNRELQRVFDANQHLLSPQEKDTVAEFALHRRQFEDRHVLGDWTEGSIRFPAGVTQIFLDAPEGDER